VGYAAMAVKAANRLKNPRALGKPTALPQGDKFPHSPNLRTGRDGGEGPVEHARSHVPAARLMQRDPTFPPRQLELQEQLKDDLTLLDDEIARSLPPEWHS